MSAVGETGTGTDALPPVRRFRARNTAAASDNKIHDDVEARRYGYGGGLVPGVLLYAYQAQLAVEFFGADWLAQGTARWSVRRPVYAGETVECAARCEDADGRQLLAVDLRRDDALCAQASFSLAAAVNPARTLADGPEAPTTLPELTADAVPLGASLTPLHSVISAEQALAEAESSDDPCPWFRGPSPFGGPLVPPVWLAARQAPLLRANFRFGPSIHVATELEQLAPAFAGRAYVTAGVIRVTYERKGNHYLVTEAETRDDQERLVCRIRHTSIFQVRQADA